MKVFFLESFPLYCKIDYECTLQQIIQKLSLQLIILYTIIRQNYYTIRFYKNVIIIDSLIMATYYAIANSLTDESSEELVSSIF